MQKERIRAARLKGMSFKRTLLREIFLHLN